MSEYSHITLVKNAVHRRDELRHFMVIEPVGHKVVATVDGHVIAQSHKAIRVREVGHRIYNPVVYIPRGDIEQRYLSRSKRITRCPLKGDAEYFHVEVGGQVHSNAAWSYFKVWDFDDRLQELNGKVAFDSNAVACHLEKESLYAQTGTGI